MCQQNCLFSCLTEHNYCIILVAPRKVKVTTTLILLLPLQYIIMEVELHTSLIKIDLLPHINEYIFYVRIE